MKIIITECKRDKLVLNWLNKEFGDLTEVVKGTKTYYVDNQGLPLIVYINNVPIILINYDRIWVFFESIFGLKDLQTQEILKVWLEETYNLRGVRVLTDWNEIVKWNRPIN